MSVTVPEPPPGLLEAALHLLPERSPVEAPLVSERLAPHHVVRYATTEDAELYRRIMRVLYLHHQAFGLRLRPAQVADGVRDRYGLLLDLDRVEERLAKLVEWGALERDHDAALATSTAEWRRNRYTYDVSPAGRLTEGLLAQLDALGAEHGRLEGDRLPAILGALTRLAEELEREEPDGARLRELLEHVLGQVAALHEAALAFMRRLGALIRRVEHVDEVEFDRAKGALLEHLQGFREDRRRWSADVLAAIDRVERSGGERLVATIVAAEAFVALPGGATVAEQRATRAEELRLRWGGVRAWFVGEDASGSAWRTLNDHVVDAIRAILAIAERLIERHTSRVDRSAVLLALASRVAEAPPGEATAWLRAAFGLRTPRHFGVPEADPEQVAERGRTSWAAAPPAPVVAHLRRPGAATPGRGRGAPVPDLTEGARRLAERRQRERAELAALLERFAAGGPLRLSALEHVDRAEFAYLLAWIGRAYESAPAVDGSRRAGSADGRAAIVLREPRDGSERTRLQAPHGTLDLPDYTLEVVPR
jgi:uncharacterized protein (TIGR02677 family)